MSLTEALLDEFSLDVKELTLIPTRGGLFEVTVDGRLVFSKKQLGRFPRIDEIKEVLRQRLENG